MITVIVPGWIAKVLSKSNSAIRRTWTLHLFIESMFQVSFGGAVFLKIREEKKKQGA